MHSDHHSPNMNINVHETRLTFPYLWLILLMGKQIQQVSLLNDESEQSRRSGVKRVTFILPNRLRVNSSIYYLTR